MVDIAAQLSLTVSGPAIDAAAVIGAETADSQAFGAILANQVQANAGSGAPATPLPPMPAPAGNRQPGGKILPGAAQILPDAVPHGIEAPAGQAFPAVAAIPGIQLVATAPLPKFAPRTDPAPAAASNAQDSAEPSPVHALIKALTAALKGMRPVVRADEDALVTTDPAALSAADCEAETPAPADQLSIAALPIQQSALPILTGPAAATPHATTAEAPQATYGTAAPILVPNVLQQADAALRLQVQPALAQISVQAPQAQAQPGARLDVLTVGATPGAAPAAAVTLVGGPEVIPAQAVTTQIKVAPAVEKAAARRTADRPAPVQLQLAGRDTASEAPITDGRAAVAVGSVLAERTTAEIATAPVYAASQPLTAATPAGSAPAAPTPNAGAPSVQMPRQDFAALVDRLVEARSASAPQSTHASLVHAEFGQVSLQFQQDGSDLTVAMSSADPDFARAAQSAQAAQAVLPAERQNHTADANQRGQGQGSPQFPAQTASSSSQSHHDASGRGAERSDQQGRNSQSRNPRGGNESSNPSPRWTDRDQSQSRGGIFA